LRLLAPVYPAPAGVAPTAATMGGAPRAAAWTSAAGFFRLAGQPNGVVRLFNPDRRSSDDGARRNKTSLPDRLARLQLYIETRELRRAKAQGRAPQLDGPPWFVADAPFTLYTSLDGQTFHRIPPEELRIANLESAPAGRPFATADGGPVSAVIDPVTGRIALPAPAAGQPDVLELRVAYAYGIARAMAAGPHERGDDTVPSSIVDETNALNFIRVVDATAAAGPASAAPLRTVPSLAAALADWALAISPPQWTAVRYARSLFVLTRCDREAAAAGLALSLAPGVEHHLVAAQWQPFTPAPGIPTDPGRRGFVVRTERRAILDAQLTVTAAPAVRPDETAGTGTLILDGLELTAGLQMNGGAGSSLRIRHCTLRNPGAAALATAGPLKGGTVTIADSICGPLALADPAASGTLTLTNCVVSADGANAPAVDAGRLDGALSNVTLLGTSSFRSLEATNVLFTDTVTAERTQDGCVRYSYVADCYAASRVPRRYRCQPDLARAAAQAAKGSALTTAEAAEADLSVQPLFLDTSLEEPACAVLHPSASDGLRLGGEGQAEMGAFALAAQGLRMTNIERLFPEALPVGLEAGLIDDTRSSAAARRRNAP
jgi:hypothetical protein